MGVLGLRSEKILVWRKGEVVEVGGEGRRGFGEGREGEVGVGEEVVGVGRGREEDGREGREEDEVVGVGGLVQTGREEGLSPLRRASCLASRKVKWCLNLMAATSASNLYVGQPR